MEVTIKETVFFCDGSGHGNRMKGKKKRKEFMLMSDEQS